nr:hypothetical protein B0A51_10113 [Rachicladosporium sp. CCFEE 5018]OQO25473.1 hypothetical protein B0A51_07342 [Rachicladosporium sp. CCFEE 5018]
MATELPPDPYLALAVARDATAGAIKTSYRKLVLKFHPDKVADEAQKQIASDQFHKIQTAYEIIGDEDRRARYDAQCKLAELRREVMERQGPSGPRVDVRTTAYRMPTDSPGRTVFTSRGPERSDRAHVEERRPFDTEYFDRPRASTRKDYDYERPKRSSPRDDRERVRPTTTRQDTKENEKHRQREKLKQASKDVKRDRGAKYAYAEPGSDSDDSPGDASRRRRDPEEDPRRARDAYYEQARRQQEENLRGAFMDERVKKMFTDVDTAKDYIQRSRAPSARQYPEIADDRPPPVRQGSKNEKIEYIRRSEGGKPPAMVRRGSSKPSVVERDDEDLVRHTTRKEHRRRASDETDDAIRRPPTLTQSRSAPGDIRLPQDEPRRSYSLQADFDTKDATRPPSVRRADSMPQQPTSRRPAKPSTLRNTEIIDGYPTPSVTPDSPTNPASKYQYGREYADDVEYPTPAGYRTEVREPVSRKFTRSPSPMKEERPRAASSRMAPSAARPTPINTRTTSYKITPQGSHEEGRPSMSRHESSRAAAPLYGEVPTTRSPRPTARYSPSEEDGKYGREFRPEQVRVQSGYSTSASRRGSEQRPGYSRQGSFASPVSAR